MLDQYHTTLAPKGGILRYICRSKRNSVSESEAATVPVDKVSLPSHWMYGRSIDGFQRRFILR